MEKNLIKAKKIDTIYRYVVDTINGLNKGVEMVDVKESVYIIPNENVDEDNIYNNGCTVFAVDADGSVYNKVVYKLGDSFTNLGEFLEGGQDWLIDKANEIYDNFVE